MTTPPAADCAALEPVPSQAAALFGAALPRAARFAALLTEDGIRRGLLGPREAARVWSRHILNCAVLGELVPSEARVVDVGSGAGLPGLALAIARPDLRVDLVEPLQRRVEFLVDAVDALELTDRVRILRGRAEERSIRAAAGDASVVTARAVAPLDRLVRWCLPLLAPAGVLLALKGASAAEELTDHAVALRRAGVTGADVVQCGLGVVTPPTVVVRLRADAPPSGATKATRGR